MKSYDFDTLIDRTQSGALKHAVLTERYGRDDLLPLWVADMDFATPDFIVEALQRRLEHPIFGYTATPESYLNAIIEWTASHHGWVIEREWLSYIPGIVKGIGFAIQALTRPDEKVIIQPPVYHHFRLAAELNGREVVENPLIEEPDGGYRMDFKQLERVADPSCRVLVLSNPHNPAGVVWSRECLEQLAHFCHRRGIIVLSDEIHCDMALYGHRHHPFATCSTEAAECSITFAAPTKTFNIAGIVSSYAIVPNPELRQRFYGWVNANELGEPNLFAPIATEAAFRYGEAWRVAMLHYVEANIDYVIDYCARELPAIKAWRPQASFLVWLDCRGLGLGHEALNNLFINRARLALNDGAMFGPGGEGFMRLNVGTPRAVLTEALTRLKAALQEEPV